MTSLKTSISFRLPIDRVLTWALRGSAILAGSLAFLLVAFIAMETLPILTSIGPFRFFTDPSWHPLQGRFNLMPMLVGTLLVATGAVILAAPLGVLSALFCRYYAAGPLAVAYRRLVELLAGIPSVVYGLWGLVVLVPLLGRIQPPGQSLLAGILILALMILPTIALLSDSGIANVPREHILAGASLGLTRWGLIRRIVLPSARPGIIAGIILGAGRALGETMAVLMVAGNVVQVPSGFFDPVRTLTANIALEMAYALDGHRSALFVGGLLLALLTIALVAASHRFGKGTSLA